MGFWDSIKDAGVELSRELSESEADGTSAENRELLESNSEINEAPSPIVKKGLNVGAEKLLTLSRKLALRVVKEYHPGLHINYIHDEESILNIVAAFKSGESNLEEREVIIVSSNNVKTVKFAREMLDEYVENLHAVMSEEQESETCEELNLLIGDASSGVLGSLVKVTELVRDGNSDGLEALLESADEDVSAAIFQHKPFLNLHFEEVVSGHQVLDTDIARLMFSRADPSIKLPLCHIEASALARSSVMDVAALFNEA